MPPNAHKRPHRQLRDPRLHLLECFNLNAHHVLTLQRMEDDADALDVMIARGFADGGNARLVSGNVGNGSGGRHEQLDELEDLVATVGMHKAVACLRGALGTVAGDEVPPLVVRDGTNSCAGAMRADDREFFDSMLSG